LQTYVWMNSLESQVSTRVDRRGLVITLLADQSLYASGSAELPPKTKRLLDEIDALFLTTRSHLRVEGNTDNVPIQTSIYPTNWELSAARATGVTRYLVEDKRLSPLRVSLAGYGEYRPRADNASPQNRRFNRRVDIQSRSGGSALMSMLSQEEIDALVNNLSAPDAQAAALEGRKIKPFDFRF